MSSDPHCKTVLTKKVVVIGDPDCGKSCLLSVFLNGTYPRFFVPPRLDNLKWQVQIDEFDVSIVFLDTMGNDGPNSNRPYAYYDADAVMICYSIGSKVTLDHVTSRWLPEISNHFNLTQLPMILIGLKKDLRHDFTLFRELRDKNDRMVRNIEGKHAALDINAFAHFECSAKRGDDLRQVFIATARATLGLHRTKTTICNIL